MPAIKSYSRDVSTVFFFVDMHPMFDYVFSNGTRSAIKGTSMIILFWIFFSFLVALVAARQGRFWPGYFVLSFIISPLLTVLILAVLGSTDERLRKRLGIV